MENQIVFYHTKNGNVNISINYLNDTFWLPQKAIATLFGVEVPAISKHLKNIFESEELNELAVVSKMETTASEGKKTPHFLLYLDAIIAVGYQKKVFLKHNSIKK